MRTSGKSEVDCGADESRALGVGRLLMSRDKRPSGGSILPESLRFLRGSLAAGDPAGDAWDREASILENARGPSEGDCDGGSFPGRLANAGVSLNSFGLRLACRSKRC